MHKPNVSLALASAQRQRHLPSGVTAGRDRHLAATIETTLGWCAPLELATGTLPARARVALVVTYTGHS